ncbi:MAG: glycosyltransferase family 4 protein [Candidatus Eisenbacteria sp.]|nr:glycosyltransferase family 4 protein [Candidatus Eisenbacteria bacterium]
MFYDESSDTRVQDLNSLTHMRSLVHVNEKGGNFGGTEEYIDSLSRMLAPLGVGSHLLYGRLRGKLPPLARSAWMIPGLAIREGVEGVSQRVLRIVAGIDPDVVYVHNVFDGRILRELDAPGRRYSILWYIHDHYPTCLTELRTRTDCADPTCRDPLSETCLQHIAAGHCLGRLDDRSYDSKDLAIRLRLLDSARNADAIVVVSDFMKEVLLRNLPGMQSKIHVLPRQVRRPAKKSHRTPDEVLRVLFSGRITYEKGLHNAIRALSRIQPLMHRILFKIAGPIESEDYWRHCQDLIAEAQRQNPLLTICHEGCLHYADMDALYQDTDVVVVPSLWAEPLGIVVGEALANGASVVASNVGELRSWIVNERTGLLVEPGNILALAVAFSRLLCDPDLRARLSAAGRCRVAEDFNDHRHLAELIRVVELCRRNRPESLRKAGRDSESEIAFY